MSSKRIALAVTNDLVTDQRMARIAETLSDSGADVLLIGRLLPGSLPVPKKTYRTKRFKMAFRKGPIFYLCYNFRLFLYLLFQKTDVIVSNDLDTLLACYLISKIKGLSLVYDSHEYFIEVPELQGRKVTQKIWFILEKNVLPKVKYAYTVCDSLANIYQNKYSTPFITIRNLPVRKQKIPFPELYQKMKDKNIIVYQGSINLGRGLEKVINAMPYLENTVFMIIGRGDIENELKSLVRNLNLNDNVIFTGVLPYQQLHAYTQMAHIGISLEENICESYYLSLPNKIFDYIQARVPVLASSFPEINKIIMGYEIGVTVSETNPEKIAKIIRQMLTDDIQRNKWLKNLELASDELIWEKEKEKLLNFYKVNNLI